MLLLYLGAEPRDYTPVHHMVTYSAEEAEYSTEYVMQVEGGNSYAFAAEDVLTGTEYASKVESGTSYAFKAQAGGSRSYRVLPNPR